MSTRTKAELEAALRANPNDAEAFASYAALLAGLSDDAAAPEPVLAPPANRAPVVARSPSLEASLLQDLGDIDAWRVYLDHLEAEGDPRGELGAIQVALAGPPGPGAPALLEREQALFEALGSFLAPTSVLDACRDGHRASSIVWRAGFIASATLIGNDGGPELEDLVADLLAHDAARFLTTLIIGPMGASEHDYRRVVELISAADHLPLRKLFLADFTIEDSEISWSRLGALGPLLAAHRDLEDVVIRGGGFELGEIDLPRARSFAVRTGGLWAANIRAIMSANWPALTRLELWFGSSAYGAEASVELLDPLFVAVGFESVTDLGLMNGEIVDEIAAALPGSPIAQQLERLDLSMGVLSNDGARALAAGAATFPRLRELDVGDSHLGPAGEDALRAAFGHVQLIIGDQRGSDDPIDREYDERYVQVGE